MSELSAKKRATRYIGLALVFLLLFSLLLLVIVLLTSYFTGMSGSREITISSCESDITECNKLFRIWSYSLNQRIFEWSLFSGRMIFWLSALVTVSGLAFSFWQFWEAFSMTRKSESSEFHFSPERLAMAVKVKSIGALVLLLSIAYLAIYAEFIYPIDMIEIPLSQPNIETTGSIDIPSDQSRKVDNDPVR